VNYAPLFIGSAMLFISWIITFITTGDPIPGMSLAAGGIVLFWIGLSVK